MALLRIFSATSAEDTHMMRCLYSFVASSGKSIRFVYHTPTALGDTTIRPGVPRITYHACRLLIKRIFEEPVINI